MTVTARATRIGGLDGLMSAFEGSYSPETRRQFFIGGAQWAAASPSLRNLLQRALVIVNEFPDPLGREFMRNIKILP
jgi:hypothetical protein